MSRLRLHLENHLIGRIGWLRAAVLGANDGIISNRKLDHWRCRGGRDAANGVCTIGLRANGKFGKINRKAVSGANRCLFPGVGGVHGNSWPELTMLHSIQDQQNQIRDQRSGHQPRYGKR